MVSAIGIDVGGTKTLTVRMESDEVVAERRHGTPRDAPDLVGTTVEAARALWTDDVAAVGIGIAGLVRWPAGIFLWGPHVDGGPVALAPELEEELGVPVIADNDANAAAHAEARIGAAAGYQNMLMVTLGTGIGGALVLDGAVRRGASYAGEFGHTRADPSGSPCNCGKSGCWETYASGPALARLAAEHLAAEPEGQLAGHLGGEPATPEAVVTAAGAGIAEAERLVNQVGVALGEGLCDLVAMLDPEIVVIGGGLGSIGEPILEPARGAVAAGMHGGDRRSVPPIVRAALGPRSAAIGAALLAGESVGLGDDVVLTTAQRSDT